MSCIAAAVAVVESSMAEAAFPADVFPSYVQTPTLPGRKRTLIVWAWSRFFRQQEGTTVEEIEEILWKGNAYLVSSCDVCAVDTTES